MSILTPKMKQYRDELAASNSNCKLWFPCDDASGTTITDAIGGIVLTDASATHDVPHGIDFGVAPGTAPTTGVIPAVKANSLLVMCVEVDTLASLNLLQLGGNTGIYVKHTDAQIKFTHPSPLAETADNAVGVAGQKLTIAAAVIGDTLYHYTSVNLAGIVENGTADASDVVLAIEGAGTMQPVNTVTLNSVAIRQTLHGIALFSYDRNERTTTEIIAGLNEIDKNWTSGKKYIPESLL